MKKAIIIPPEPSITSFVVQLWGYQDAVTENTTASPDEVVFILDRQDYDRVRRLAVDSKKYLSVFISLQTLADYGKIEFHDYSSLYGTTARNNYVSEIDTEVGKIRGRKIDYLSSQLHGGWMKAARSNRLLDIREAIGEDRAELEASKIGDKRKLQKMKNGTASRADTYHYITKLLKRLAVAFVVANKLDSHPNYPHTDVEGIIARPGGIEQLKKNVISPKELFSHDTSSATSLFTPSTEYQKYEKSVSTTLDELSREIVEHDTDRSEIVPGLEFLYNFNLDHIRREVARANEDDLREDARKAKEKLELKVPIGPELRYMAEKAQESIFDKLPGTEVVPSLLGKQLGIPASALINDFQNYSLSLKLANRVRELSETDITQTGLLVAATTLADPIYRYERHPRFYQWFNTFLKKFDVDSPSESDRQWYQTQRTMTSKYIYTGRWYE